MTNRIRGRSRRHRWAVLPRAARIGPVLLAGIAFAACARTNAATAPETDAAVEAAVDSIRPEDIAQRIAFLASDRLRGRNTPSPGLDTAAHYIADAFASFGLEPGGPDGSFLQRYELRVSSGTATAPNVIGILRGRDPDLRDTYVVFSAHMDHVGVGPPDATGDSIYNGADDDASGVSAVMEIAQSFTLLPEAPRRSVIFLTVSGEELGLFGSEAFVRDGPVPADRIVANINIDMIGRNAPDTLVAIGLNYSDMGSRLQDLARAHPEHGLVVVDDLWPAERFFFRSDHYNFARAGVPALFLFAGVHEDYHRPSDHADRIDNDKAARIAKLAFRLGVAIANDPVAPEWTRAGRAAVR